MVQRFLEKAQSRSDSSAPCPVLSTSNPKFECEHKIRKLYGEAAVSGSPRGITLGGFSLFVLFSNKPKLQEACSKPPAPWQSSATRVFRGIPACTSTLCTAASDSAPGSSVPSCFPSRSRTGQQCPGSVPPLLQSAGKMREIPKNW